MQTCKGCSWWKLIEEKNSTNGGQKGRCLSGHPTASAVVMPVMHQISREVIPQIIEVTSWPLTGADADACGDFKPNVKPLKVPDTLNNRIKLVPDG